MATATLDLIPEVGKFLDSELQQPWVGGKAAASSDRGTFETHDPGSGEKLATVPHFTDKDVDAAVAAAQKSFDTSGWATMPPNERGALLHRLADEVERRLPIIAQIEALDAGKLEAHAQGDVANFAATTRYFADMAQHISRRNVLAVKGHEAWTMRQPWGPCGFIFPWNFPFLLIGWGVAPALAAGNTVVVKPAEDTPLTALWFGRLVEEAGIPAGVVNIVTGTGEDAGAALARHPGIRRMSFTGSPEVGRLVARACGENLVPAKLELGGKGAAVVFDDVDVAATARALAAAVTLNAGQVCCTATRWLVHRAVWRPLVDAAVGAMRGLAIGHGSAAATQLGPVVSARQRERVLGYLRQGEATGATALLPGGAASVPGAEGGFYVKPALLTGDADNLCAREEIFGPIAYLMPFEREDEAIALVNRSPYGLANSVWSADLARAGRVAEALEAGNSWINAHNVFAHGLPYGGCNLSGLGGGVLGPETLDDYLRPQSIVRPLG